MAVSHDNRLRFRAIQISRQVKAIFLMPPERLARAMAGKFLLGMLLRWLFLGPDGHPHRAGEIVLAELRKRHAGGTVFSPDAVTMARRVGRREAYDDLINLLNLDEETVQKMMELDDGLE